MYNRHLAWILLILAFGALVGGCAHRYGISQSADTEAATSKAVIAVLPFHGVSEVRGSGTIISDILANQLYAIGKYAVIAPELVAARLADREGEPLSPHEAGTLVGAPYILTGSVTEYTYKAGVGETPVVGVTARLIDTSTGAVVWSSTQTATGGGNWFQEDSLSCLSVLLCKDVAESLDRYLQRFPLPARSSVEVSS